MQANGVLSGQGSMEPFVNSGDAENTNRLQQMYYSYDPVRGTLLKRGNTAVTFAGLTVAGAAGTTYLAPQLPYFSNNDTTYSHLGNMAIRVLRENPLVAGAVGGLIGAGAAGLMVYRAYNEGLKPRTAEAVKSLMQTVIRRVENNLQDIARYNANIEENKRRLSENKSGMLEEKKVNEKRAEDVYQEKMQKYNLEAAKVAGELNGYVSGIIERMGNPDVLPGYDEAQLNQRPDNYYALGRSLSRFMAEGDYSFLSQIVLVNQLKKCLTEEQYRGAKRILNKLPIQPVKYNVVGVLEKEWNRLQGEQQSNQREVGILQQQVRELLKQYPVLEVGAQGKVKEPSLGEFYKNLPE